VNYKIARIFVTGAYENYCPRFFTEVSCFQLKNLLSLKKWLGYLARDFGVWCLVHVPCQKVSSWFSDGFWHSAWSSRFWYFSCRPHWHFCSDLI